LNISFKFIFINIEISLGRPHGKGKLRVGNTFYNVEFIDGKMQKKKENEKD
jgi:hypothetical protein